MPSLTDNLAALRALTAARSTGKATDEQIDAMRGWRGWGALPKVFDRANNGNAEVRELKALLGDQWGAARRTVLNAHYTAPNLVELLWGAADRAGIKGGYVLEIGCGRGDVIDGAPAAGDWTFHGVELDPTTAEICRWTHPGAEILAHPIEQTDITHGGYDLVIGNVPFSSVAPAASDNASRMPLHDYCITRALDAVRPGGIVALITSRYTLDKVDSAARERWAASADLIAAWRLTSDAHSGYAGTKVVTDVVVFRRRYADETPNSIDFVGLGDVPVLSVPRYGYASEPTGATVRMNTAFTGPRPAGFLFGRIDMGGMYSDADFTITRERWREVERNGYTLRDEAEIFAMAIAEVPRVAKPRTAADPIPSMTPRRPRHKVSLSGDTPAGMSTEGVAMYEIGVTATAVLTAERSGDLDSANTLRERLAAQYSDYVNEYGRIRRPRRGVSKAAWAELMDHNVWPIVGSLEHRDSDTGDITEAALLTRPVIAAPVTADSAASPLEAVGISIAEHGAVNIDRIASLLGLSAPEAVAACTGVIFFDPEARRYLPAPVYLSGNVRQKLVVAKLAAESDSSYNANVAALEEVAPKWVPISDIHLTMASPILNQTVLASFLKSLGWGATVDYIANKWTVTQGSPAQFSGARGYLDFNPTGVGIMLVLRSALNGVYPTVKDTSGAVDVDATTAAADAIDRINERFAQWVIADPEMTELFETEHNTRFNAHRTADFSGVYPDRVVGMASDFHLRDYQSAAVAMSVLTPGASLIGQPVGAGKTAVAASTVMEWLRIGRVNRCMVVVPNALLEDFVIEWQRIFPLATILVGGVETSKRTRGQLYADIASGAYPITIVPQSMFERLPSSPDAVQAWIDDETAVLRASLEAAEQNGNQSKSTVKRIEKAIAQMEARLERAAAVDNKDGIVPFDLLGIDALVIDEIHGWKRLPISSSLPGMSDTGSQRAVDLAVKLHTMRATARHGLSVLGLTGTYVTNRVSEIWTMMRYLAPEVLDSAGTSQFDDWAAVHAETVTTMEMNPTGSGWRESSRIAMYKNMPELMGQVTSFANLMSAEELEIERPDTEIVVFTSPATSDLADFVVTLVERAEACTGRRTKEELAEDNMLKVVNDGRLAALDMRLVGYPSGGLKLPEVADKVAKVYAETATNKYLNRDGTESPNLGALQLVFCSLGVHTEFSAWEDLTAQMVARGIPADRIRNSNEMTSSTKRAKLLADCRNGKVSVLLGTPGRIGLGVNIQDRIIAIHEVNPEWRPDIHIQLEGRGDRFGNQNPKLWIYRYVTAGSFDVYMWSTLERKMKFVAQVASGKVLSRDLPELDATIYSFAQAKAAATGDPRHLDLVDAENELSKLRRLSGIHAAEGRRRVINAGHIEYAAHEVASHAELLTRVHAANPRTAKELRVLGEVLTHRQIANRLDGGDIREFTAGGTVFKVRRKWGDSPFEVSVGYDMMFKGTARRVMADVAEFVQNPADYIAFQIRRASDLLAQAAAERDQPPFAHDARIAELAEFCDSMYSELSA